MTEPTTAPERIAARDRATERGSGSGRAAGHAIHHLRAGGTSLVLDLSGGGLPRILHWGDALGEATIADLEAVRAAAERQVVSNGLDVAPTFSVVPEQSTGWLGTPGLSGHRDGRDFSTAFAVTHVDPIEGDAVVAEGVQVVAADDVAGLLLAVTVQITHSGVVRLRGAVTNVGETPYTVDGLAVVLPVPIEAEEILDLTGRHVRERAPQRHAFTTGTHARESRRGRTGLDATLLVVAGVPGFSFRSGEVWGVHVAWSGNHRTLAERTSQGDAVLGGGELLLPGEMVLQPEGAYRGPWVYGSHGHGLDALSARFHEYLRARPGHPRAARPVVLNTWEAVYFDHDPVALCALADAAAEVGVERFVLDDGWSLGRRSPRAGLGDWWVDPAVWPDGLGPLVSHVRSLGMDFGLWFEPEMVSPDSELARRHPDWILSAGGRLPPSSRSQQVLDLTHPRAYAYVRDRLDAIVTEYAVDYIKWDHNRDLVEAGRSLDGRPGVHLQTRAAYRLMDELRERHPALEIESCSSGGGRIDLEVLERTDRVWASDCIDALERRQIERWTALLLPPELIGSHVGAETAQWTGRRHALSFRAGTALFWSFGIEWDLRTASSEQRAELARWVSLYKSLRPLLHTGRVVRADHPDPALQIQGTVARDGSEAVFAVAALATSAWSPPGRARLPGLEADARYRLRPLPPADEIPRYGPDARGPRWWDEGEVTLTGRVLGGVGVQIPALQPERLVLIHAERV